MHMLLRTPFSISAVNTPKYQLIFFLLILVLIYSSRYTVLVVFNATFNNISVILWQSILLVEGTGVHREDIDMFM
jgi:hypothetical protein